MIAWILVTDVFMQKHHKCCSICYYPQPLQNVPFITQGPFSCFIIVNIVLQGLTLSFVKEKRYIITNETV